MNTLYKFVLFVIGSVLLVSLTIFIWISTVHTWNTATTSNTVSFNGTGKIVAKPDVAVLDFSIMTEAPTSKAAQDANSKKSNTVIDFLTSHNVDAKDIKTSNYNVSPTYTYPPYGTPKITGYQVNQSVEVKIRALDSANTILDGLVAAGVNQVSQLSFQVDNPDKLKSDARKQAIADAQSKAQELEDQIGLSLGKIVNFSEDVNGSIPTPMYLKASAIGLGGGAPDVAPSLPSGENEIAVNVTLTYQIK